MKSSSIRFSYTLAFFFAILFFFLFFGGEERNVAEISPLPLVETAEAIAAPLRIKIPKIKVDAEVLSIGLTSAGDIGTPKGPKEVSWFSAGPIPGDAGNAIISGHYGWKNKEEAVFDNLKLLKKGDLVYVTNSTRTTTTFRVRESKTYKSDANVHEIFEQSIESHLNLITCSGDWNKAAKEYTNRLVVFTDKVSESRE